MGFTFHCRLSVDFTRPARQVIIYTRENARSYFEMYNVSVSKHLSRLSIGHSVAFPGHSAENIGDIKIMIASTGSLFMRIFLFRKSSMAHKANLRPQTNKTVNVRGRLEFLSLSLEKCTTDSSQKYRWMCGSHCSYISTRFSMALGE